MPEGPEAHTIAASLKKTILEDPPLSNSQSCIQQADGSILLVAGQEISPPSSLEVSVANTNVQEEKKWIIDINLGTHTKKINLCGLHLPARIIDIKAYGKKVLIILEQGIIVTSLGMTGRFCYYPTEQSSVLFQIGTVEQYGPITVPEVKHYLYFHDSRRFGSLEFICDPQKMMKCFSTIGLDMLADPTSAEEYKKRFKDNPPSIYLCTFLYLKNGPPTPEEYLSRFRIAPGTMQLCTFLLDQSYISGVGNYLKSEIMYACRIKPDKTLNSITDDQVLTIREATIEIINRSFRAGGLTLSDYWAPDDKKGNYQPMVYGRQFDNYGNYVQSTVFNKSSRTTYWVPNIQI